MLDELLGADSRRRFPELRLLVLFGSRGRGDAHEWSDWDLGYLADDGLDELALRARLSSALGTDRVDVVNLEHASGVLRYQAARDGKPLHEREGGEFERFAMNAILFWLDAEPVVREAHAALLERLG